MNSQKFKQIAHLKKSSTYSANTKTLLLTINHMAFSNLRTAFVEVWKIAQMYLFELVHLSSLNKLRRNNSFEINNSKCGGNLQISFITVSHMASCS